MTSPRESNDYSARAIRDSCTIAARRCGHVSSARPSSNVRSTASARPPASLARGPIGFLPWRHMRALPSGSASASVPILSGLVIDVALVKCAAATSGYYHW